MTNWLGSCYVKNVTKMFERTLRNKGKLAWQFDLMNVTKIVERMLRNNYKLTWLLLPNECYKKLLNECSVTMTSEWNL